MKYVIAIGIIAIGKLIFGVSSGIEFLILCIAGFAIGELFNAYANND